MSNATESRKNLTAAEARKLADTSYSLENNVYKEIRNAASENRTSVNYSIYNASQPAVENLVTKLRADGYTVQFINYDENGSYYTDTLDTAYTDFIVSW